MDYQKFLNESLIEFVKKVLTKVQIEGLKEKHHFYISFVTSDPHVQLSERMKHDYPEEITIVLQNRFNKLEVNQDFFSVELSFNNIPEIIIVPFRCLNSFADPSVNFNLQLKPQAISLDQTSIKSVKSGKKPNKIAGIKTEKSSNVIILDKFRNKNQTP